jgi:twin BRCT domain/BRCA1 C Terminus (BRCT) domain
MAEPKLFDECVISIVPSKEFSQQYINEVPPSIAKSSELGLMLLLQLQRTLEDNGAVVLEAGADGNVRIEEVTHIISTTSDFPQYRAACEQMIPVVVPEWIKSSLLKNRQAQLRPFTPDPKLFFSGVVVCCADLPDNDKDAIIGGVLAMGGQESSNLTRLVTHIVALTTDNAKVQQAQEKQLKCKVVLPHWYDKVAE